MTFNCRASFLFQEKSSKKSDTNATFGHTFVSSSMKACVSGRFLFYASGNTM